MIGDMITYDPGFESPATAVLKEIGHILIPGSKFCLAIGGESGCGKSSLAHALKNEIGKTFGLDGFIFHTDDYFNFPPQDNHFFRVQDISRVGPQEVDIEFLDAHISAFKKGQSSLKKPLVDYYGNRIVKEEIDTAGISYCIVEGTYACLISGADYRLFMEATYIDTEAYRKERNRDTISEFNDRVLAIEHNIIKQHAGLADLIIDKHLKIRTNK